MSNSTTAASGGRVADYSPVEVQFTPDPGPDFQLLFDGMHAEEELGRPFLIRLELSSEKLQTDVAKLVGRPCLIWMYLATDEHEPNRYFHGIVTRVISAGTSGGAYRYKVELRPWIWLLSQTFDCRIFQKMKVKGDLVEIKFFEEGRGLTTRDGNPPTLFQVAGADQQFHPAVATITNTDVVTVRSDQVKNPVAVRFAWREDAVPNLMNKEGLPASPFRTDDWKLTTQPK